MPVALALARRDGLPCNAARRGLAFRAGTRAFDGKGQNVLQPSVLSGVSAPAFCFAEWNMRRDVHRADVRAFALPARCRYGEEPAYAQGSGEAGFAAPKPSANWEVLL